MLTPDERKALIQELVDVINARASTIGKKWGALQTPQGPVLVLPKDPEIEKAYLAAFAKYWGKDPREHAHLLKTAGRFPPVVWQRPEANSGN